MPTRCDLSELPDGSFVFLKSGDGPHGSALLQLSADGERLEVVARGFRHPFGMGAGPNGEITVADSEGNWVPSSKIDLDSAGRLLRVSWAAQNRKAKAPPPLRPLCYIPKVADNSCGGQFWHTSDSLGAVPPRRHVPFLLGPLHAARGAAAAGR